MAACPHCRVENPPAARFCNGCGARLTDVPSETRKMVTVLFCDVAGYTATGERLDAEALRRVQGRYFDAARDTLERHEAVVEKFIGDAVMAVFGIPVLHEDDALRAVRAGIELQDAVTALGLRARVGVNTGEVVAGDPGAGHAFVTGDAVNTAKRLEESAGAGEVVVGETTRRLLRELVELERREPVELRGKKLPVRSYRVVSLDRAGGRQRGPLVGREQELELLHGALQWAVEERACHLFTLQGAAGIGKSRLVDEFILRVGGEATTVRGRCLPYGEGITFWPLAEIVLDAAGLRLGEPPGQALAKIEALLAGDEHASIVAERVGQLIGLSDEPVSGDESFWAVRRLLETIARTRPLVVVVDDLHWAEPTFLDLVEHVVEWSRGAPILVLCTARAELLDRRPGWGSGKVSTSVLLEPLAARDALALVEHALGDVPQEAQQKILAAAEGNPLFLEEMAAMLEEEGRLVETPPTIQALVSARIDRLEPKERAVLEAAAVEGRVCHRSAVTELVGPRLRGEVGAQLVQLVRKDLLWPARSSLPEDEAFRFRHLLIRDAAYAAVPKGRRADLHERFADWLDEHGSQDEVLGYHLERAYRYRTDLGLRDDRSDRLATRAGEHLGRAGRRAFARDDMHAALVLLDRAVALVNDQDPARIELQRELSFALWTVGEVARAESLLKGVIESAAAAGDRRVEWYALLEQAARRHMTDPAMSADELLRVTEEAIAVYEELGDDLGLARAWRRLSYVPMARCHFGQAEEAARRALRHARAARDVQEEARSIDRLCTSLLYGPTPAQEGVRRCAAMLRDATSLIVQANVASSLSGLFALRGRFERARELYSRAGAIYEEVGLRLPLAGVHQIAGEVELLAADSCAAEQELRAACEIAGSAGPSAALLKAQLARSLLEQGRIDESAELAFGTVESCGDDIWARVTCLGLQSRIDAIRGVDGDGVEAARAAVSLVETTDALNLHANVLVDLGEALRRGGHEGEAQNSFAAAKELYGRKGNLVAEARMDALLGERV
jgi:class 3 adenylate cyclase/tetratricopeptide (TPR) repeat protein